MTVETLHDKFVYELQQVYYIETELVDVLDEMVESTPTGWISRTRSPSHSTRTSMERRRRSKS